MADVYGESPGWRLYWNEYGVHATDGELWLFRPPPFWPATNAIERDIENMKDEGR